MTKKSNGTWANRIVGYGEIAPDQALANEANWRVHPYEKQQKPLLGILREVGLVQNVLINKRLHPDWPEGERGVETVVDGHLRISLAISEGQPTIPVTYVDLSPEEERLVLVTFDPISALAATDKAQLDALLRDVSTEDAAVMAMLAKMAEDEGIKPPNFEPVGIEEQGRLDEKKKVTCPDCGAIFEPK